MSFSLEKKAGKLLLIRCQIYEQMLFQYHQMKYFPSLPFVKTAQS
jgi:hypothetical protein